MSSKCTSWLSQSFFFTFKMFLLKKKTEETKPLKKLKNQHSMTQSRKKELFTPTGSFWCSVEREASSQGWHHCWVNQKVENQRCQITDNRTIAFRNVPVFMSSAILSSHTSPDREMVHTHLCKEHIWRHICWEELLGRWLCGQRQRRTRGRRSNVQRAEPFLLCLRRGTGDLGSPLMGLCCCCQCWWEMELCWWGAASADRIPGCTLTAGNHPDNCSGNVNTAGWGFAIQKSGASETGSCFFLLLFLSNKIPSCLAWETCNIAIPKAIKKSHKPDLLQHPPQWSYLKTVS